MTKQFNRADISGDDLIVLNKGRWGNAVVYLLRRQDGPWVIKDFSSRAWLVRNIIGRHMIRKELGAMTCLAGIDGIPADAFRLDAFCVCYRFVEGHTLRDHDGALSEGFFEKLETLVDRMHKRGMAHLDLRYRRNILVTKDMAPAIIDFQSGVYLGKVPRVFHELLKGVDLSGVYKHWERFAPGTMGAERRKKFEELMKFRKFWIFRGYMIQRFINKIKGGGGSQSNGQ